MITIGDSVPKIELRTDEGTPLALTDLEGRAFCLLLLGVSFTPTVERLLDLLGKRVSRFLSLNVSPVAVIGDTVENLADHRAANDVPFLLVSDENFALHNAFRGGDDTLAAVWIIGKDGVVRDVVPMLPPSELVAVSLERVEKALAAERRKR